MNLFKGIKYNLKGLVLGFRTPKLFFLGCARFIAVMMLTIFFSGMVLYWHQDILNLIWTMPESGWFVFIWKIVSWFLSFLLVLLAAMLSYLLAQLLFSVFIMDYMSKITEQIVTGKESSPSGISLVAMFFYLLKQEIPRALIPLLLIFIITAAGFLTPFGPAIAVVSSVVAAVILAWDNTDLVPARRMLPFSERLRFLRKNMLFHVGFGLWFLIPWLNILFLSFAPVGATLYYLEDEDKLDNVLY